MKKNLTYTLLLVLILGLMSFTMGCDEDDDPAGPVNPTVHDPDTSPKASVDRFSGDAGTLMVRTDSNGLPGANEAIDFDSGAPFITMGLGPNGEHVQYYNFDVQSTTPAPIYALFREGADAPVDGQLNIVDVIPGDAGYNDFWLVTKVTVPSDYVANTITSYDEIMEMGFEMETTTTIVNCPIVPDGSTASMRGGSESADLHRGWYNDMVVYYFTFEEAALMASNNMVPVSPIYVTFNINVDEEGGGPASGFVVEDGTSQTHNVVATIPSSANYSPLWLVSAYNNADFDSVMDWETAAQAEVLAPGIATVNCPVVSVE
ncbi:hypothetical protein KQI63_06785 [bacterium]|nr:hypothetical protein [bacterium]